MAKTKSKVELDEDLALTLADNLNKQFKASAGKIAYFLEGDTADSPSEIKGWVPTGCTALDLAISNRPNGGFPMGRIVEITGLEASGKSLLAAHALANTQKMGGIAVYVDTENATSTEFLSAIGVNLKEMLYVPLETIEDIFESIESIIESVRKSNKDTPVTIVVDSVAAASTKTEMAAEWDKDGYNTAKAIILSKAMRKITNLIGREKILLIFTNQLRSRMNAPAFSDPWTTSGGKAIAFHASVRLRLSPSGMIKEGPQGKQEVTGINTTAKVVKNRMGPPLRVITYPIYFNRGIDDDFSLLELLKKLEIVSGTAGNYNYVDTSSGEVIKFKTKDFRKTLLDNPVLKEQLYQVLCDKYVMKYKSDDVELSDELSIDTNFGTLD
jgi:recombination protein RecA